MRFLDAAAVRAATPWPELIAAIAEVLAEEHLNSPERHVHPVGLPDGGEGALLLMPAWIDRELIGVKTVTYFPSNAGTAVPTVNAAYQLLDGRTGQLSAVLDGDELTDRRTAAISALAADHLARAEAERLLVVGTGRLSPNMARAHAAVRPLRFIIEIWGRRPEAAEAVAEQSAGRGVPRPGCDDHRPRRRRPGGRHRLVRHRRHQPLVRGDLLAPEAHPGPRRQLPARHARVRRRGPQPGPPSSSTPWRVPRCRGDLAQPLADGVITEASIVADLRALAADLDHPGRTSADEITLFKSAGFAAADLAAARLALG